MVSKATVFEDKVERMADAAPPADIGETSVKCAVECEPKPVVKPIAYAPGDPNHSHNMTNMEEEEVFCSRASSSKDLLYLVDAIFRRYRTLT